MTAINKELSEIKLTEDQKKRFWDKVDIRRDDECWNWNGDIKNSGYGRVKFSIRGKQKAFSAHRIAFLISNGTLPEDLNICHTCDNRLCTNPKHLFSATQKENMQDASKKGRCGKLTKEIVEEIRSVYASRKITQAELSKKFGVCRSEISQIISRVRWRDL